MTGNVARFPMASLHVRWIQSRDCELFLKIHAIDHLFEVSVCMEDGPPKLDPFPVIQACELLGVEPSDKVLMVGDTPDDIRSALAAG